jgi:predicted nuclease with TOPRIM domain
MNSFKRSKIGVLDSTQEAIKELEERRDELEEVLDKVYDRLHGLREAFNSITEAESDKELARALLESIMASTFRD